MDVDPADTKKTLIQALGRAETAVGFLLGAGCSCSVKDPAGGALIPSAADFTALVFGKLLTSPASAQFKKLTVNCFPAGTTAVAPTIELVLSRVRGLREIIGTNKIFDLIGADLDLLDDTICRVIEDIVGPDLPAGETPHSLFARWIREIKRPTGVELFTTNYDLLIEQALERARAPFFDGFAGADEPFFDLSALDLATFPKNWSCVWKLHGSINWRQRDESVVRTRKPAAVPLVFPSHLKYAESRRLPYLPMRDRLRALLKSRAVFITCGYSFGDAHLNEDITYGLSASPASVCYALLFGPIANYPEAKALGIRHQNLNVLASDGGVLRGKQVQWIGTKMGLGDFSELGRFLVDEVMGEAVI